MHHKKDKKKEEVKEEPVVTSRDEDESSDTIEGSQQAKEQSTTKGSHSSFFKRWKKDKKEDNGEETSQKSHKRGKSKDKSAHENTEEKENAEETEEANEEQAVEEPAEGKGTGLTVIPAPEDEEEKKSERRKKKKKEAASSGESYEEEPEVRKSGRKERKKKKKSATAASGCEEDEGEDKAGKEGMPELNLNSDELAKENEDERSTQESVIEEEDQQQKQHKKKKSHRKQSKTKESEEIEPPVAITLTSAPQEQEGGATEEQPSDKKSTKEKSHRKKKKEKIPTTSSSAIEEEAGDGSDFEYSIVDVSEKSTPQTDSKKKEKEKGKADSSANSTSSTSTKALSSASTDAKSAALTPAASTTSKSKRRFLRLGSQSYSDIPAGSSEEPPSDTIALSATPSNVPEGSQLQESASSTSGASSTADSASEQQIIFKPAPAFTPVVAQSTSSSILTYGLFGRKLPSKPQKSMSGWTQCRALQKVYGCNIGEKQCPIRVIKWSRTGEFLASGNKKGDIYIWKRSQPNEGSILGREAFAALAGHTSDVLALDWFENGNLISGSRDNTAIIWTLSDKISMNEPGDFVTYRNEFASLKHDNSVTSVATCPNNKDLVLTGCMDNTIRMWNLNTSNGKTPAAPTMLYNVKEPVNCVSFSLDSNFVIVGTTEGNVLFCSAKDFVLEKKLNIATIHGKKSRDAITGFAFRAREPVFLVSSTDGYLRLYDSKTLKLRKLLKGFTNTGTLRMCAGFSDDGTYVVCGSEDKSIYVWNTNQIGETSSDSDKEILSGEGFRSSLEKMTAAQFVPRLPNEKNDVMEGRFIAGADRFGYVTIYENPKLFFIDDETTEDSDEDSEGSSSDSDDSSSDGDDDDVSESVCEENVEDN